MDDTSRLKRIEEINRLRAEGKTLTEIGRKFGISRERVRQLCKKSNYEKQSKNWSPFRKLLSTRSQKCLKRHFECDDIFTDPNKITELIDYDLLRIKNLGIKSADEIKKALESLGYTKH